MVKNSIVPSDWMEMIIGNHGRLQKKSINPQSFPEKYFQEYSMPAFDENKHPKKVQGKKMHSNRLAIQGDVLLFNKLNVRQKRIWYVKNCEEDALCSAEFLPYVSEEINLSLLAQILATDKVTDDFIGMSTGSSNSQKRISPKSFLEYSICLPKDLDEQKSIATALSDVDELIANLEKLIEKKRAIKQGTMQELLTGKKRLPGFNGEWTEFKLGDVGSFRKGSGISRDESNTGTIPAVRYGELYTHHNDYIKSYNSHISENVASKAVLVSYGDVVFACSGETKEDIGKCAAIVDCHEVYAGGDIIILHPTIATDPVFLGTVLNAPYVRRQRAMKAQGDAIVHISAESIKATLIKLPCLLEQQAIASVLLDMDNEIDALINKHEKYVRIKQGMMQKLLTGEIRLV